MAQKAGEKELPDALSHSMIRSQLDRILASGTFSRSERLSAFLRFIVEETLAGRAGSLKEQVVGDELYGKGSDFDAAARPVVRVDARRLRDKLREYYSEFDHDTVIISLPKGAYVPLFEKNSAAPALVQFPVNAPSPSTAPRSRKRIWVAATGAMLVVASSTVLWFASRDRHPSVRLVPLTSYPGDEGPPTISPDGNLVAFMCRDGDAGLDKWGLPRGNADICVKAVGTESVRHLTETPYSEIHPAWSPDGKEIVFVRNPPGTAGIFVVSHLGGHERKISDSGTHPCWTPDGKSMLVRDRAGERSYAIYSIALDTLERRQVTFPSVGMRDWDFDVSPDGETLAFIRLERSSVADVYVMAMQGGEPRRVTDWKADVDSVTWTADGRELIYAAAGRLWRIPANGSRIGRGSPLPDIPMPATQASISRAGRGQGARLVFRTPLHEVGMRLIDLSVDGKILEVHPFSRASRNSIPGPFSPDGSIVAFTSDRGSTGPNLWVVSRDGVGARQITFLDTPAIGVSSWSPDGARIAFDAVVDGNTDVYVIAAAGGKPVRLTSGPSIDYTPEWSPDGKWIYFSSTASGPIPEIWKVPANGGTPQQITHGGGFQPKVSPDGEHLYYLDRPPPNAGSLKYVATLLRMPLGGGDATLVHERIPPFYWSVSSRGIYFLTGDRDPATELHRLHKGKVAHVGTLPFIVAVVPGGMTVSRDGRWALVSALQRRDADLMLLENFR
jgi:Tol biopolymer transport system component